MKIGNYTDDEILEFMTEGEGRGFLGRSMFDAMYFEIERLKNIINELEEEYINYMDKQDFAKKYKISRPYLDKLLKAMNRKEIKLKNSKEAIKDEYTKFI